MPLPSDSPSTPSRQEFCVALKAARERKGITLARIAETTKIPASLFADLERNDLRRWPKGLFRRSFFRDYARVVGLPTAESCAEFVRLFPDDEGAAPAKSAEAPSDAEQAADVRLVLDAAWHGPRASALSRLLAAGIDAGIVIVVAAAIAWVAGQDQFATAAIVGLAYFSLATALVGESPAKWAIARRGAVVEMLRQGPAAIAAGWRSSAEGISTLFQGADTGAVEPEEEPELRPWITDAHRVGPAPRLRVRIKLSQ